VGFTLVEVVAALVVLGVLLVMLLRANSQYTNQLSLAGERLVAAREADRLIAVWMEAEGPPASGQSGEFGGPPRLLWQTMTRVTPETQSLGARVVQLRVFSDHRKGDGGVGENREPVLTVDLLVSSWPAPKAEEQKASENTSATLPTSEGDDREDPRLREAPHVAAPGQASGPSSRR
jgi:prepilin-type N-terminal cleavage/methylation domain-containing protein